VFHGDIHMGDDHKLSYASGTSLAQFPLAGTVVRAPKLTDQVKEMLTGESETLAGVPFLGLHQPDGQHSGRIVVYGDSNCLDSAHMETDCLWFLDQLLNYTATGHIPDMFDELIGVPLLNDNDHVPKRLPGNKLHKYSKVVMANTPSDTDDFKQNALPECRVLPAAVVAPITDPVPDRLFLTELR